MLLKEVSVIRQCASRDAAPKENDNDKPRTAGIGLTEGLYIGGAAGTGKPRTVAGKPPVKRAFSILGERRTARKVGKAKLHHS